MVSGAAALLLQHDPTLTPNDVKCRLIGSTAPAVDAEGNLAYSLLQQGSGLLNVYNAMP